MTGTVAAASSPVAELWADRRFRRFWFAQFFASAAFGTLRFTFVWFIVTLTDWPSAEGIIGMALGLPTLLFSAPAGAWSDRADRRHLFIVTSSVSGFLMAGFGVLVAADVVTPLRAGFAAIVLGTVTTVNQPNISAMVPLIVAPNRLMNAVALQNGGQQAANFLGLIFGGLAIQQFGNSAGFFLLAALTAVSIVAMLGVDIPLRPETDGPSKSLVGEMSEGARFAFSTEPLRSLLLVGVLLGGSFSVVQITLPRVVESRYGMASGAAGLLLGVFGMGMLASSIVLAGRPAVRHGRNVAICIGVGLGMGQFLVSLAPSYPVALAVMVGWGINAGVAMTSHRTLIQSAAPPALMGRVMGLMMLGLAGALPLGALVQTVLAPRVGPVLTMRWVGAVTMALTIPLTWRRIVRDA